MEIEISHLSFEELDNFIQEGDFSIKNDFVFMVKKTEEKDFTSFGIKKMPFKTEITSKEFKKEFKINQYRDMIKEIMQRDKISFKAICNGEICGVIVAENEQWEDTIFIDELVVDKVFRNMGVGSQLLKAVKKAARSKNVSQLMLQVDCRNYSAIYFYIKGGFKIIGVIQRRIPVLLLVDHIEKFRKEVKKDE